MVKYLSGRQKLRPSDKLTEDRYQYLGLDQAEPNLADPATSPGVPSGLQYQLVAVTGYEGRRYWVPVGGSLQPGAITVFDEGTPVSSASSITQMNFVGAAVTAQVSLQNPSGHPGIAATVTVIPVTVGDSPPIGVGATNNGELWWESDTGDLFVYYDDGNSAQWVMANAGGRGLAGDKGEAGDKGQKGDTGLTGGTGAKGDKGEKGAPSTVAGPAGDKGQKGEIGAGDKGQKGEDGSDGAAGDKGQKGELGTKGDKGDGSAGGASVTISDNAPSSPNNGDLWWESDTFDLHVYYQDGTSNQWVSITSNAALKGEKGDTGAKGQKGEVGSTGSTGDKGQKGEIGSTGGTGGTGSKGQKGEVGAGGSAGSDGSDGDKGQKGEVGATGSGTGTADKIFENDTSVECVDTGTGIVEVKVDGTEVITVNAGITTFNNDVLFTGINYDARWNKSDNELEFKDNARLGFGDNGSGVPSDLTISHNTLATPPASQITNRSDSQLEVIADMLELRSGTSDRSYLTANVGAATTIFHSHTKRFETTTDGVKITGGLQDKDGQLGTSGQVLSSTGTELNWVAATSGQKGEKGQIGADGGSGADGAKGQKGDTGTLATNYTSSLSNSVQRTVQSKFDDFVNILDFGVEEGTGKSSTVLNNNTTRFEHAVAHEKRIYIPAGTYEFNNEIDITNKSITLFGDGERLSILSWVSASSGTDNLHGIHWNSNGTERTLTVKDLKLQASANRNGSPIYAEVADSNGGTINPNVVLENVVAEFNGNSTRWKNGFYFDNCRNSYCNRVVFRGNSASSYQSDYGFLMTGNGIGCLDFSVFQCQVSNVRGAPGAAFLIREACEGVHIESCLAIDTDVGVQSDNHIDKDSNQSSEPFVTVTNCHFNTHEKGILFQRVLQSFISDNHIQACDITDSGSLVNWMGIEITAGSGANDQNSNIQINNNIIHADFSATGRERGVNSSSLSDRGAYINYANQISFNNNQFKGCDGSVIEITSNTQNSHFLHNRFDNCATPHFSNSGTNVQTEVGGTIPSGGIIIWSGASNAIPSGWYLCDGNNSTPDLRNRFIIGAGNSYSVNATGGYTDVFIPEHTHTFSGTTNNPGDHNHSYNQPAFTTYAFTGGAGSQRCQSTGGASTGGAGGHTHTVSGTTAVNTGGAAITNAQRSGRNLPPYYALCYIMKS